MDILFVLAALVVAYYFIRQQPLAFQDREEVFKCRCAPLVKRSQLKQSFSDQTGSAALKSPLELEPLTIQSTVNLNISDFPVEMQEQTPASIIKPEDSILKRHFLQQQKAERQAITHPYPADSVLLRHHLSTIAVSEVNPAPLNGVEKLKDHFITPSASTVSKIPEDSVLHRHFVNQLRAGIELAWYPKPADSILNRHYEHFIQTQLADSLLQLVSQGAQS